MARLRRPMVRPRKKADEKKDAFIRVRVTDDISLDFTAGEKLVGIEVLGASRLFQNPAAPVIELRHVLPQVAA